jgi:tetratricopeptide (TPR) repeat protein
MSEQGFIQRWKKHIVITVIMVAALVAASYYIYGMLDTGELNPVALLVVAAVIAIGIPMLRSNFFPSRRDCESEYAFHEQRLEKEITQAIDTGLGQEALNRIFYAPGHFQEAAEETIGQMLTRDDRIRDHEVQFALLMALARYYEKTGDPASAIPVLRDALGIKPQHFVAGMHLAGNYEWAGATDEARQQYETLLENPEDLSTAMKKLVTAKIKTLLSA